MRLDATAFVGDQQLIEALKHRSRPVDCSQNQVLFRQGEVPAGLYILHDGEVHLTMRSQDGELLMDMPAEPGSLLGLPGVIGNQGYTLSAFAKAGASVSFVPRDEFSRLMLNEPGMAMMILQVLAAEVRTARAAAANA